MKHLKTEMHPSPYRRGPNALLMVRSALAIALLVTTIASAHGHGSLDGSITVQSVTPGSPAAAAGLEVGDRLLRLDGQEIARLPVNSLLP